MLAPSKTAHPGPDPTAKAPSAAPSLARSFVTTPPAKSATQMLAPSKAAPVGAAPAANVPTPAANVVVRLAGYHCRSATWSGLRVNTPETTLPGALCWAALLPLKNIVRAAATTTKVASNPIPLTNRFSIEFSFRSSMRASSRFAVHCVKAAHRFLDAGDAFLIQSHSRTCQLAEAVRIVVPVVPQIDAAIG